MENKQHNPQNATIKVHTDIDKPAPDSSEDTAENTTERTEQEEDIISPKADTDLVEGDIKNDAVLAGEQVPIDKQFPNQDYSAPKKDDASKI